MTEVVLRSYAPGDEAQILDLYRVAFGLEMSLDEWRWHYADGAIIELAEADGRIVGHYAVRPRPFWLGERACTGGHAIGSMVAPEFRNVKTFIDLAHRAYARCRERGWPFVYAFPNDNVWLVRRRMLGWQALPPVVALAAHVPSAPVPPADLDGVVRLPPGAPLDDAAWLGQPCGDRVRTADSPSFIRWRLRARPHADYPFYVHREAGALRGYMALKRYASPDGVVGHIIALRTAPGAEAISGARLIACALEHFRAAGIDRVTTWIWPASPLHAIATAAGLAPAPGRGQNFGYLAFDDATNAALADAARWDIAMTDSDVF